MLEDLFMERDFKGVWIPKEIWLNDELTALDKIILTGIIHSSNDDGVCIESDLCLAKFCQCSATKISKTISKLIDSGYLRMGCFNGRQCFKRVLLITSKCGLEV